MKKLYFFLVALLVSLAASAAGAPENLYLCADNGSGWKATKFTKSGNTFTLTFSTSVNTLPFQITNYSCTGWDFGGRSRQVYFNGGIGTANKNNRVLTTGTNYQLYLYGEFPSDQIPCFELATNKKVYTFTVTFSSNSDNPTMKIEEYSAPITITDTQYRFHGNLTSNDKNTWDDEGTSNVFTSKNGVLTYGPVTCVNNEGAFGVRSWVKTNVNTNWAQGTWYNVANTTAQVTSTTTLNLLESSSSTANVSIAKGEWTFTLDPTNMKLTCTLTTTDPTPDPNPDPDPDPTPDPAVTPGSQTNYPGGVPVQGTVKNADGSVTFCIAAPGKNKVTLVGSWDNYQKLDKNKMCYQDYNGFRYFWTTVSDLDNSTWYPYYYNVDDTYNVADPYSTIVLDPVYDAQLSATVFPDKPAYPSGRVPSGTVLSAYKGDVHDYAWEVPTFTPAPKSVLTIYETLIRDFTGESYTADGTFLKAIEKIPYLKDLGITAVELMPVMEFENNVNWGYDTYHHFALDKSYGSPADFKKFVDECHKAGIAVILDVVFNHTCNYHPWYAMYAPGTSPFFNAEAPHAWSVHNDIKQEYGLWEPYFNDVLKHWMTNYKVDGFRFDLVKGMGDNSSYNDNYSGDKENPTTVARMKRLHAKMMETNPNVIQINEFFGHYNDEVALGNDGQMVWNHQHQDAQNYAKGWDGSLEWCSWSSVSRPEWGTVDYVESHDEQWMGYVAQTSNIDDIKNSHANRMKRLGSIAAQFLAAYGPKMIWEFGELGFDDRLHNGVGETDKMDPKRVPWNYLNDADRKAVHDVYRAMIHLRNDNPDLFASSVTPVYTGFSQTNSDARSIRLTSTASSKEVIVCINPWAGASQTFDVPAQLLYSGNYKVIAASKDFSPVVADNGWRNLKVTVPANSFCVLATDNVVVKADGEGQGNETTTTHTVAIPCATNGWSSSSSKVTVDAGGVATIRIDGFHNNVSGVTGAGFKVLFDGNWLSTGGVIEAGVATTVNSGNNANMTVASDLDGKDLIFTYDTATQKLTVTAVVAKEGDVNGDGYIDINDVYFILNLMHQGQR